MRATPTLARLDRMFVNNAQCTTFPQKTLSSLVRQTSDHTPIMANMTTKLPKSTLFRFENAWLHNKQFLPTVLPAWHAAPASTDAAGRLAGCLKSTRAPAKVWAGAPAKVWAGAPAKVQGATSTNPKLQIPNPPLRHPRRGSCSLVC